MTTLPPDEVCWHQGLLLQPQHFQHAALAAHGALASLLEAVLPHHWGVGELELALDAIGARTIDVRRAQLIFPGGHLVAFPGNAVLRPRTFDPAQLPDDIPVTVYLGLHRLDPQACNVTACADADAAAQVATRWATLDDPPELADLHGDGPGTAVRTLKHVVRVFFEPERPHLADYDLIPIARITRDGDLPAWHAGYIPPCYAACACDALQSQLSDLRDIVVTRTRQLDELKGAAPAGGGADPELVFLALAARSLGRASAALLHLLEHARVHPWHVYGTLRQLVGELSGLSDNFDFLGAGRDGSPALPPYDPLDLYGCFAQARRIVEALLDEVDIAPRFRFALLPRGGMFTAALPAAAFDPANRCYLIACDLSAEQGASLARDARLAAPAALPGLLAHALPGIEMTPLPRLPRGMPRRARGACLRIESQGPLWEAASSQRALALHWSSAPEDAHPEIVVLREAP